MKRTIVVIAALLSVPAPAFAITIDTVPVGNPGNPSDQVYAFNNPDNEQFGSVASGFRMGTYEVTVGQYAAFLNAVAATDTYDLYNVSMTEYTNTAGISRSGSPGSYTYDVFGSANKPVTFVNWGDAARFANWLHNGQPIGTQNANTTEDGAYTLNGATSGAALAVVTRNPGAQWFLPTENEWYKSAFYDPVAQHYWEYPTATNEAPYSDQPPGSDAPSPSNTANFRYDDQIDNDYNDGYAATGTNSYSSSQNYLTEVGAFASSASPYATFDQAGNVTEWIEASRFDLFRGIRGGHWSSTGTDGLHASYRFFTPPASHNYDVGFRVATIPEPSTFALGSIGVLALLSAVVRRRRAPQ